MVEGVTGTEGGEVGRKGGVAETGGMRGDAGVTVPAADGRRR